MAERTVTFTLTGSEFRYFFMRYAIGSKVDEAMEYEPGAGFEDQMIEAIRASHAFAEIAPLPEAERSALVMRLIQEARAALGDQAGLQVGGIAGFGPTFDTNGVKS